MRIAILGAECTGKTSLGLSLVKELPTTPSLWVFVPEYLREWCDRHRRTPRADEQVDIARQQALRVTSKAASGHSVIADTAPLMTAIYSDVLFQDASLYAEAREHHTTYDMTLVTGLDLPWVADGIQRDGVATRALIDGKLREVLQRYQLPYVAIYGTGANRLQCARDAISHYQRNPIPRSEHDTQWKWACDTCSDADCEHRLFSGLVEARQKS